MISGHRRVWRRSAKASMQGAPEERAAEEEVNVAGSPYKEIQEDEGADVRMSIAIRRQADLANYAAVSYQLHVYALANGFRSVQGSCLPPTYLQGSSISQRSYDGATGRGSAKAIGHSKCLSNVACLAQAHWSGPRAAMSHRHGTTPVRKPRGMARGRPMGRPPPQIRT